MKKKEMPKKSRLQVLNNLQNDMDYPTCTKICFKLELPKYPKVLNEPRCISIEPSPSKQIICFFEFNEYPNATIAECPIPPII